MYIKFKLQNKPQNFNVLFTLKIELTMLLPISAPAPKMAALPNLLPNFMFTSQGVLLLRLLLYHFVVIVVVAVVVGTVEVGSN